MEDQLTLGMYIDIDIFSLTSRAKGQRKCNSQVDFLEFASSHVKDKDKDALQSFKREYYNMIIWIYRIYLSYSCGFEILACSQSRFNPVKPEVILCQE